MNTLVKIEEGRKKGIISFLKSLLEKGIVTQALVPMRVPTGTSFAYILTKDPNILENCEPIAPVMPIQGARIVSKLTKKGPLKGVTAVILRPCELRALRELVKLKQAQLDGLLTISFDCPGVFPLKSYLNGHREQMDEVFWQAIDKCELEGARPVCSICYLFSGELADLEIGFGGITSDAFSLTPHSEIGEKALRELGYEEASLEGRQEYLAALREKREIKRKEFFKEFRSQVEGPEGIMSVLANCINCHNCMRVCPVCFCRECFFDSDALKVSPEDYMMRAERKGGLRFMPDTLLFHLGRMNHMSLCCVSCGMCEDACPVFVPVARLFALVADETQNMFHYIPGRDLEEPIPYLDYQEEELKEYEQSYTEEYAP